MKAAHINSHYKDSILSKYLVKVEYEDGKNLEKELARYSYSEVFEWIEIEHKNEADKKVKSIKIDLIR